MAETVRLKDIADELGLSVVTVSNALSGKKGVSDAVRQEIRKKASELGYKIDKGAAERFHIGVVVSEKHLKVEASFYWALYQKVVCAAAQKRSTTMIEILDAKVNEKSELPQILSDRSVDGLLVIGRIERRYLKKMLQAATVPVVFLDFCDDDLPCDAVLSNNYLGMYRSTRYLLERGHRDIMFLGTVTVNNNIMDRYFGFRKAMEEWGIRAVGDYILEHRNAWTGEFEVWLPKRMPTAFACASDFAASYLYDKLVAEGYRVPEDVSLVGYDNYLYGHVLAGQITTYNVGMERMAEAAVELLVKRIGGCCGRRNEIRYIDGEIVERSSVKPL